MEAKELREMSVADLAQKRLSLREEIGHLKLQRATSRLETRPSRRPAMIMASKTNVPQMEVMRVV